MKQKPQTLKEKQDILVDMILTESNLEKAEIVLAVKGEIVDKLQRYAEVISNLRVDVMGPLLDRIKAESGVAAAENFNANVAGHLDECIAVLMDAKDKISTETLKLTGDITDGNDISDLESVDVDTTIDMEEPTFEFEDDSDFEDLDAEEEVLAEPIEREMKESQMKLGVYIETKQGTRGNKFFESKEEMRSWLTENESKLTKAKVIKILK